MAHKFSHVVLNRRPPKYDCRDFRLADFITPSIRRRAATLTKTDWPISQILDQGDTPHCVGFAWAGFGVSLPIADPWNDPMGDKIYYAAKVIDGEPGQEDGSDTRSGVKAFMQFAQLEGNAYAFASNMGDVITWVLTVGPVITGTNWYNAMFEPNTSGLVRVKGGIAGGHEWMISGVDTVSKLFHCTNSWGTSFGINGQFYIGFSDYLRLLNEQGDACTAAEVSTTPAPTPVPPTPPPPTPEPTPVLNIVVSSDFSVKVENV